MVALPQKSFRGLALSFDEFHDLLIIGMVGLNNSLLRSAKSAHVDGMVNYKRVAEGLGLNYEPGWLEHIGRELDNREDSLVTHESAPDGEDDDGYWVYLNSGIGRIGELLHEKYYSIGNALELNYDEFRDALLFELAGMVQDCVDEEGGYVGVDRPLKYNLTAVADHFNLFYEQGWLENAIKEWLDADYIVEDTESVDGIRRFELTRKGYYHAQDLAEIVGEGMVLNGGQGTLYFSVDASHISRLGLELVAKQETAVAELVKNGYDADATSVDLIFNLGGDGQTSLEIFDNGSGMDIDQLAAGFMRLSTPNKVAQPRSELFGRQKAGRKGIGRFAAQRLGRRLILETTTSILHYGLRLEIDWEAFEANSDLTSVPSSLTRIKKPFEQGTRLTITDLRDSWSIAQIERSHRHIAELIQPFPLSAMVHGSNNDPGFKASFARDLDGDIEIIADDWSLYFRHALAEIEGEVDHRGFGSWSLKSERFGIQNGPIAIGPRRDHPTEPYSHLQGVKFKAFYYIDKETQHSFRSKVAEKLQSSGGIRLYRNGFRVLPYGERFDDWLKLNASNLLRKVLPPHSNRNFLGFVEINDVDGANFEETSSREGLLENESFLELKDFVSSVLKTAILPIAEARDKRLTTTDTRQKQRSPKGQADDIIARLTAMQKSASDDPQYAAALSAVVESVRQSIVDIGSTGEALLEELGMTRVLASLGLTIGEFTHEIRLSLETARATAALIGARQKVASESSKDAENLLDQFTDLEGYLTYFDATVRDNVSREVASLEMRDVVNAFISVVFPKINRSELTLEKNFDGFGLFVKPMHKSEWASILINLFTNSLKAIRRAGVKGRIRIECGRLEGQIYLDFMDNGDGIPKASADRIFEAFYTTTSASGASEEDGTLAGMGMGLKIVKDIVQSANGEICLFAPRSDFSTCFRVTMPEATSEELPDNAY